MGRSKEMGRPMEELTREELLRERGRCRILIQVYGNKISAKELRKRLLQIEKRIEREAAGD